MAASATFALKLGVWFRRARLLMVSPDSRAHRARRQAETPLNVLCRFPEPALIRVEAHRIGIAKIQDKPISKYIEQMQDAGNKLREKFGPNYLAEKAVER